MAGDARKQIPEEHDQLFGYAGTATALEYDEEAAPIMIDLGTDGTGYDAIIRPGGGARHPITPQSLELVMCEDGRMRHACQTRMKGMDVFAFGITTAPKSIRKILKECDIEYVHPIIEHSWGQRVVRFYDPDKHIIEVGENMKVVCKRFLDSGMTPEQVANRMDVPMKFVNTCMR